MSFDALHPQRDDARGLLTLELDHGKANEIGTEQLHALDELCEHVEGDPSICCLCTTSRRRSSKGTPIFIAGANVVERQGWSSTRVLDHVQRQRALMTRIQRLPVFTIALVHGVALGWGVEFCLASDRVIATDTASFGLPETGLGIVPGALGTAELAARVGLSTALLLGCTGSRLDADHAHRVRLVDERVGDLDEGLSLVCGLAEALVRRSPTAVATYKRAVLGMMGRTAEQRRRLEHAAYMHTVLSGEAERGRTSFEAIRRGEAPTWGPRALPDIDVEDEV